MLAPQRPQLFLGQAVLARRAVVDAAAITRYGWATGGAEVCVQNRGPGSNAALFGEVFHAVDDRLLAAVLKEPVSVRLKVTRVVLKERGL